MKKLFIISGLLLLYIKFSKNKKMESTKEEEKKGGSSKLDFVVVPKDLTRFTEQDAKNAILYAEKKYGKEWARIFEKIYRNETAHFKSGQFLNTGTPGMEIGGWSSVSKYLGNKVKVSEHKDPVRGIKRFIIWNDNLNSFADFFYDFIHRVRKGNWAAWNSLNPEKQEKYRKAVLSVSNKFID